MSPVSVFDVVLLNRVETLPQQHKRLMCRVGTKTKRIHVFLFLIIRSQMTNDMQARIIPPHTHTPTHTKHHHTPHTHTHTHPHHPPPPTPTPPHTHSHTHTHTHSHTLTHTHTHGASP